MNSRLAGLTIPEIRVSKRRQRALTTQIRRDEKWLWVFVPINAAIGGLNTLLPLYVISLGGTVIDVGNIVSAYSLALIPSSILWGFAVDAKAKRKPFVTYGYLGITIVLIAGFFTTEIGTLSVVYVCYAIASTAASPAVSLLLIDSSPKKAWSMMFAKYSALTLVGTIVGVIPGIFWTEFLPLRAYFLLCAIFSGVSVILAAKYLVEPQFPLERKAIALTQESLVAKLRTVSMIFITIPSVHDIKSFGKLMRSAFTRHLPLLYMSFFFFFMASNLFFTSYTPFLKSRDMGDSEVFAVFSASFILQAAVYPITGRGSTRLGEGRVALSGIILRIAGFLATTVTVVLMFRNSSLLTASVGLIAMIGASFALYNGSSSVLLFRSLAAGKQGELLGVYSALTGMAMFLGSILSGYLSFQFGYAATFLGAVALLSACAFTLKSAI